MAGRTVRLSLFTYNNSAVLLGLDFRGTMKDKAAKKYLKLLDSLLNSTLVAYLDGL
jgi:hypothetical protein